MGGILADPGLSDLITLWDRLVESAGNYAALIGGEIGLGHGWEPAIATTTGSEAISPDLIANIERLKEAYDPAISASKKYRAEIDLVTEALRKMPAEAAGPLQDLKDKIEAATFAASADGKTMDWLQTLVDKAGPAKTEADLLTEALEKLDGLLGDLIDVQKYQEWGDALRGALDKARQGAKDATAEFDRLKTSLTEQLYAIGKTQAEILRFRLETAKNDDGSAKYIILPVPFRWRRPMFRPARTCLLAIALLTAGPSAALAQGMSLFEIGFAAPPPAALRQDVQDQQ